MMKKITWLITGFAIFLAAACSNPFFPPKPKAVLNSLVINQGPAKTFYIIGDDFEHEGLEVIGIYSDDTEKIEPIGWENLSGYDGETPGPQTITVSVEDKAASFTVTVCDLQYIEVSAPPEKTDYAKGEDLNLAGLVVTGYYSYEDSPPLPQEEPVSLFDLEGYDMEAPGKQTITVTVKEKTDNFTIKVYPLDYIAVTIPGREHYLLDEALDLDSMEVTGYYANHDGEDPAIPVTKIETLDPAMISGYAPGVRGNQTVTITIDGKTTGFTVTVWEFTDLRVTTMPLKVVYIKGEELDIFGLEVTGSYFNGAVTEEYLEPITMANIDGYDRDLQEVQTITVTVRDRQAEFDITVEGQIRILIYLDDPPGGVPENITLSKTGISYPYEVVLTLSLEYAQYAWFINNSDSPASMEETLVLNAHGLPISNNLLRIEVKTDAGIYYGKELIFTVEE